MLSPGSGTFAGSHGQRFLLNMTLKPCLAFFFFRSSFTPAIPGFTILGTIVIDAGTCPVAKGITSLVKECAASAKGWAAPAKGIIIPGKG